MPDVPDADNENVRDEEKEKTINDPITYPHQISSSATEPFMERKDDKEDESRVELHDTVAPAEEELLTSVDQNIFAKQTKGASLEVEDLKEDPNTEEIKEASILWSPRLLLAISIVLVSCCSNVIFLELLVRQVFLISSLLDFIEISD